MRVVVGVGMSSKATVGDVSRLVVHALAAAGATIDDVSVVATRETLAADPRLHLGAPVVGFDDNALIAASGPVERAVGIPARVAETAAILAAGPSAECSLHTSEYVTVAIAREVEP